MLSGEGQAVALSPKALDLLIALVSKAGHVVDKDDLMREVWPGTFVEENNLTVNISALRKALAGTTSDQDYIQTVPRRGYRFVASVRQAAEWGGADVAERDSEVIVGREPELRILDRFLREAAEGAGRMIFITGEPGIGKTALSNAFLRHVGSRFPLATLCRGRCLEQYGAGEPSLPYSTGSLISFPEPPANSLPTCSVLAHPPGAYSSRPFLAPPSLEATTQSSVYVVKPSALPKSACCAKS